MKELVGEQCRGYAYDLGGGSKLFEMNSPNRRVCVIISWNRGMVEQELFYEIVVVVNSGADEDVVPYLRTKVETRSLRGRMQWVIENQNSTS